MIRQVYTWNLLKEKQPLGSIPVTTCSSNGYLVIPGNELQGIYFLCLKECWEIPHVRKRLGDEERRLMHLVPAPAVRPVLKTARRHESLSWWSLERRQRHTRIIIGAIPEIFDVLGEKRNCGYKHVSFRKLKRLILSILTMAKHRMCYHWKSVAWSSFTYW